MSKIDFDIFEKILVRHAMLDSEYLASISDYVQPKYFEDKNIAKYFEIVDKFYEKRNKLPTFTEVKTYLTTDDLKKGFKKLVESFKTLDIGFDRDELYDNTEKFLKERGMYHAILESAEDISEDKADTTKIVQKFEKIAGINLNADRGIELFGDKEKIIDDILNEEAAISSKWKWLDEHLGGGFRQAGKALYVFAGQANIGKSIFLGNVAANIALQGKNVLVVTLEMSETLYAQRIASNVTKIPMKDFKNQVHTLRNALEHEEKNSGKLFIKEFPPSTITPKQLSAFVKRFADSGIEIDAIVIDYLGLLHSTEGSNSYERIKYICEQTRAMSYVFKCPIISASQLNRSNYNTSNPGLDSLAESLGIAMVADVILSIFQNEEDLEMGVIRLGMIKNRFGMRGMTQAMRIAYATLTIYQSDDDEEEIDDENNLSLLETLANL
jgi:replicative DNA helicase